MKKLTSKDLNIVLHALDILQAEISCMDEANEKEDSERYAKEILDVQNKIVKELFDRGER